MNSKRAEMGENPDLKENSHFDPQKLHSDDSRCTETLRCEGSKWGNLGTAMMGVRNTRWLRLGINAVICISAAIYLFSMMFGMYESVIFQEINITVLIIIGGVVARTIAASVVLTKELNFNRKLLACRESNANLGVGYGNSVNGRNNEISWREQLWEEDQKGEVEKTAQLHLWGVRLKFTGAMLQLVSVAAIFILIKFESSNYAIGAFPLLYISIGLLLLLEGGAKICKIIALIKFNKWLGEQWEKVEQGWLESHDLRNELQRKLILTEKVKSWGETAKIGYLVYAGGLLVIFGFYYFAVLVIAGGNVIFNIFWGKMARMVQSMPDEHESRITKIRKGPSDLSHVPRSDDEEHKGQENQERSEGQRGQERSEGHEGVQFCFNCGNKLVDPHVKYCPFCGSVLFTQGS